MLRTKAILKKLLELLEVRCGTASIIAAGLELAGLGVEPPVHVYRRSFFW